MNYWKYRRQRFFLILILTIWLLQGSFQLALLHNGTSLSTIWQQQWLISTWLVLQGITRIPQGSISEAWEVFLFKGRPLHVIKNQQADSDLEKCYTDRKSKNVLQPFDHGGSKPASQCSPLSPVSSQWVRCSFIAVDTWLRLGYEGLSHFYWRAKNILGTCTKKTAPKLKQAAENRSAQWPSQVLSTNVWKVSNNIFWHELVPEVMLSPAPSFPD